MYAVYMNFGKKDVKEYFLWNQSMKNTVTAKLVETHIDPT